MRRFVLAFLCLGCFPLTGFAQDNFPDVPEAHLSYKAIQMLRVHGLILDFHNYRHGPERAELVQYIIKSIDGLPTTLEKSLEAARKLYDTAPADKDVILFFASGWRQMFREAVIDYRTDIRNIGRDPDQLLRAIDANQPLATKIVGLLTHSAGQSGNHGPFCDVPANHWAAKAVQELKDADILVGYPGDRFEG